MENKKMYWNGNGVLNVKKGDRRKKGDPVMTDELDGKTVVALIKSGKLVDGAPGTPESPSIPDLRNRLAKLESVNSEMDKAGAKLSAKHEELKLTLAALREDYEMLENLNINLKDANAILKNENAILKNENATLSEDNTALSANNKELMESNSALVNANKELADVAGGRAGPKQAAPVHVGAGIFELQDGKGTRVKGKKEAFEAAGLEYPDQQGA